MLRIPGARTSLKAVTKDRFRHTSGDLFFMSQDEFELNFLSQDEFEYKSMEGKTTRYHRAQPFTPTQSKLKAFEGRFGSEEIGIVYEIKAGETGLVIHLEHSLGKGSEIKPVHPDLFQRGLVTIRFIRDKDRQVVAFDYNNPVLKNIRFSKLNKGSRL